MFPLFQNPLLRFLRREWWLAAIVFVIVPLMAFGRWGLEFALAGSAAFLAAVSGMTGAAWLHGAIAAFRKAAARSASHHRFLCPNCLRFGGFHFGCAQCRALVHPFIINTDGAYIAKCPRCRRSLFGERNRNVAAWCERCEAVSDLDPHHSRRVRVVGVLSPADFETLCKEAEAEKDVSVDGIRCSWKDDGKRLTYILQLGDLAHSRDELHALWEIEEIWTSADESEALKLGQSIDQFIVRARLTDAQAKRFTVCAPQKEISATVNHVLTTRFGGVRAGVSAAEFIREDEMEYRIASRFGDRILNLSARADAAQSSSVRADR
ncbi:MAG: hypothetical protein AB1631_06435 [Acidobacteriota bacterium]